LIYTVDNLPAGVSSRCKRELGAGYGQADNQLSAISVVGADTRNVYVVDRTAFKVFSSTGTLQRVIPSGLSGRGGAICFDPCDPNNVLFVTDTGANCIWVIRRDTSQVQTRIPPRDNGLFKQPTGITCAGDHLVVCDTANNRIQVHILSITMSSYHFIDSSRLHMMW
jgi:DNA-binding beta-propeller fold protein YncE